jgi:diguanylate cyclase (GGDEF)-like protein
MGFRFEAISPDGRLVGPWQNDDRGELDSLIRFITRRLGADAVALVREDPAGGRGEPLACFGLDSPHEPWQEDLEAKLLSDSPGPGVVAVPVRSAEGRGLSLRASFWNRPNVAAARRAGTLKSMASYAAVVGLWLDDPATLMGVLRSAYEDGLTGCLTYTALVQALEYEVSRAGRYGTPLSCCFIDVDNFKSVNDRAGHLTGNRVLAAIGAAIRGRVRRLDVVGRYGGDEFVVVLPSTDGVSAAFLASSLRAEIFLAVEQILPHSPGVSIGISEWEPGTNADELLHRADRALSRSKEQRQAKR